MTGSDSPIEYVPYNQVFDDSFEDMPRRVPDISTRSSAASSTTGRLSDPGKSREVVPVQPSSCSRNYAHAFARSRQGMRIPPALLPALS
jgi:hypothetical protein